MFASLDPANVAAIETRFVGQSLLRQTKPLASLADALAEDVEIWIAHPGTSRE